jgi:hypothetical protein
LIEEKENCENKIPPFLSFGGFLFFSASKQKIGKKIGTNLIWGCCEFCGCD